MSKKFISKILGGYDSWPRIGLFYAIFIPVVVLYAVFAKYVWDSFEGVWMLLIESTFCVGFSFLLVGVLMICKWLEDKADKKREDDK